jgi:hypothetical protein
MVVTMTLQINTLSKSLRLHPEEPLETPIENPEKLNTQLVGDILIMIQE